MQYTQCQTAHTRLDPQEGGFALIASLLTLIVLSVIAAAGFVTSQTEVQVSRNHSTSVTAFYVADAALNDYLAANDTAVASSQGYSYAGGSAVVTASPLVNMATATMYLVSAVGSATMPDGSVSQRTVSKLVIFRKTVSPPPGLTKAALTTIAGIDVKGAAAKADGSEHGVPGCPASDPIAGVAVPTGQFKGKIGNVARGTPPVDDTEPTPMDLAKSLGIDWAGTKDGSALAHDYTVTSAAEWPDFSTIPPDEWPVTYVNNEGGGEIDLGANESGHGVLVIGGDAKMRGSLVWKGVVLVGGSFSVSGSVNVLGTVTAGLNILTGGSPGVTTIGNGALHLYYQSCYAAAAADKFYKPPVVAEQPSTWVETF